MRPIIATCGMVLSGVLLINGAGVPGVLTVRNNVRIDPGSRV